MKQPEQKGIARVRAWCKASKIDFEFQGNKELPSKRSDIPSVIRDVYKLGADNLVLIVNPNKDYQLRRGNLTMIHSYTQSSLTRELQRLKISGKLH